MFTGSQSNIKRPLVRYHGGKFVLADWIISHFPEHRIYTETFGGGASVLLKKPRCYAEIYNDLDSDIVNLFRVCQTKGKELKDALYYTPFSREEFDLSFTVSDDALEMARRTVVRSFQGFGSASVTGRKTGFRSNSNRSGSTPAHDWARFPDALDVIIERLRGVVIENRDAKIILKCQDADDALHFVDPPYKLSTRFLGENTKQYRYEMTDDQHEELLKCVLSLKGYVFISGYDNDLYSQLLCGYKKVVRAAFADGAKPRKECLWISPNVPIKQYSLYESN